MTIADIKQCHAALVQELLSRRDEHGVWRGKLSSSALSTATAVVTLRLAVAAGVAVIEDAARIDRGLAWLAATQNADGGFGDTDQSPSNISTTTLAWVALRDYALRTDALARAEQYLLEHMGAITPDAIADAITTAYGEDRTFSVPILTLCALGGAFGEGREAWSSIPGLPFELAAFPQGLFHRLGFPVVSYALPALIAIGQVIHHHNPTRFGPWSWLRNKLRERTLGVLQDIQPTNGGFLEATPLTSFVCMSLIGMDRGDHPVVSRALAFLRSSERAHGNTSSWPIDTDLATWLTTLSVEALSTTDALDSVDRSKIAGWLKAQQYTEVHPYTHAAPGGWAWTDLPGGVPDADDTPGALLALHTLDANDKQAVASGARWLADLQNADGGIPTFCRGWGKLPFDRSSPDLTAHALRAWHTWRDELPEDLQAKVSAARGRAQRFLVNTQRPDGSWIPLWFGNQLEPNFENPLYGTARVLKAADVPGDARWSEALERGRAWLLQAQNDDGGFGGAPGLPSTLEETGLALDALVDSPRAAAWLVEHSKDPTSLPTSPIGLYFAKLWYSEELYPLIFATAALGRALEAADA